MQGSTDGLLTYSVHAPKTWKAGDERPAILILHGSNMNGQAYVDTIAAAFPDLAHDYILLGINGETPSNLDAKNTQFNFTYVNFMGKSTYKGFPGTDRESPALVSAAMKELNPVYNITRYYVGGHSQGAFLTYMLMMTVPRAGGRSVPDPRAGSSCRPTQPSTTTPS